MTKTERQAVFLRRAKEAHGDRYTYEDLVYVNSKTDVIVGCSKHGPFKQSPDSHAGGVGCPKCGREVPRMHPWAKTTGSFVAEAKEKHGDRYDYSRVNYVGAKDIVEIGCAEHGFFQQEASRHLGGAGCKACADFARGALYAERAADRFLPTAVAVHGGKYSYEHVKYVDAFTSVKVLCPEHGMFEQTPTHHLSGAGCPTCSAIKQHADSRHSQEDILKLFASVHDKLFDYSKVIYLGFHTPVEIICETHGSFWHIPHLHLTGAGCPKCSKLQQNAKAISKAASRFEPTARALHNGKYDYSKVVYTGAHALVTIGCSKHGDFVQSPTSHLNGNGCPSCNSSSGELSISSWLDGWGVLYDPAWMDHNCISVRVLRFDFHLTGRRILVEYDGIQHFKPVKFSSSMSDEDAQALFVGCQHRDRIKDAWAEANSYRMVRIRYDEPLQQALEERLLPYLQDSTCSSNTSETSSSGLQS